MVKKTSFGFTLLEAVTAMALWCILITGLLTVWSYASRISLQVIHTQETFENARGAMDAIINNIELSDRISIRTDSNQVLSEMKMMQRNLLNEPHEYDFTFNIHAQPGDVKYQRLEFNGNEFASQIASVMILRPVENRLIVTVVASGDPAHTFSGSVDIRYKDVTFY